MAHSRNRRSFVCNRYRSRRRRCPYKFRRNRRHCMSLRCRHRRHRYCCYGRMCRRYKYHLYKHYCHCTPNPGSTPRSSRRHKFRRNRHRCMSLHCRHHRRRCCWYGCRHLHCRHHPCKHCCHCNLRPAGMPRRPGMILRNQCLSHPGSGYRPSRWRKRLMSVLNCPSQESYSIHRMFWWERTKTGRT